MTSSLKIQSRERRCRVRISSTPAGPSRPAPATPALDASARDGRKRYRRSDEPRYIAAAASDAVAAAIHGPCPGVLKAATPKVVPTTPIPAMTNTSILLLSLERARSSSNAPVMPPNAMQDRRDAPASTVTTAPTAADDENPASRLDNQASARIACAAREAPLGPVSSTSGVGGSRGDNPANTIDTRAAAPSRPRDTSADAAPIACGGAAVITPTNAATATTVATHDTAVNVTAPQPDARIANTQVTAAAVAASNTLHDARGAGHRQETGNRRECGGDRVQGQRGDRIPIGPVRNRPRPAGRPGPRPPPRPPRWRTSR